MDLNERFLSTPIDAMFDYIFARIVQFVGRQYPGGYSQQFFLGLLQVDTHIFGAMQYGRHVRVRMSERDVDSGRNEERFTEGVFFHAQVRKVPGCQQRFDQGAAREEFEALEGIGQ